MILAAPPAPQRDAVVAWNAAFNSLERDINGWSRRLAKGRDPLTPGEQVRLRSLITAVETLTNMPPQNAQIAAAMLDKGTQAARESLASAQAVLPQHAVAAAMEVANSIGWQSIPNERAIQAIVNGEIGQLTSDYVKLSADQQLKLSTQLATGLAEGQNPKVVAKRISSLVDDWFTSGQARSVMIARTNMARAYDLSSQVVYQQASADGLIKGWKWVAHGKNPCEICKTLDGHIFPSESDTYRHPNCTCQNVPVLMDEKGQVTAAPESLELVTTPSGWTSWREKPKSVSK